MGITIVVIFVFEAKQIVYMCYDKKYYFVYFQTKCLIYVKHDIVQLI